MRVTAFCIAVLSLLGAAHAAPADGVADSVAQRSEEARTTREAAPTPRMSALAHILSGDWVENQWFSVEDVKLVQNIRISPVGLRSQHPPYLDKVADPARCAVLRSFLNHAGGIERTVLVEIDCVEYWRKIELVDRYYEQRGCLPISSLDLATVVRDQNSEGRER